MRCSTLRSADMDDECLGTATHLMLSSIRNAEDGERSHHRDPVCEPCGRSYERRPAYKARIVPLYIHDPLPAFTDVVEGHRLVDHPFERCHDCLLPGGITQFRFSMLHGCPARPESIDHLALTREAVMRDANGRAAESARLWFEEAAYTQNMAIEDWRPVLNHRSTCAYFTFRDLRYRVKYDLPGYRIAAEKLKNRGLPPPVTLNPEHRQNYKAVAFRFYDLVSRYATYTPGREDISLHAPEGQISSVLRLNGLNLPESTHLAQATDAVCDAFGAIAQVTFYE